MTPVPRYGQGASIDTSASFAIVDFQTARAEITDALLRYTRGIDRLDGELVASAFHPGAMCIDYGADAMTIEDFVTYAIPRLGQAYTATQHRVSNIAIDFSPDGERALCEAYVLAFHTRDTDDGPVLHTFNGRYIDRFTVVDSQWRIAERTLRVDWSKVEPIDETMGGAWVHSARDRSDVVYQTP